MSTRWVGVHSLMADQQVRGERWLTCACGEQWHGEDRYAVWAQYWVHTQRPSKGRQS